MLSNPNKQKTNKPLELTTQDQLTKEVTLPIEQGKVQVSTTVQQDQAVETRAQQFVEQLLNPKLDSGTRRDAVDNFGTRTTDKARHCSAMLQQPIKNLQASAVEGGGPIADGLVELTMKVEELDPVQLDKAGAVNRLLGKIPGFGKPLKKYFLKYESAQTVIDRIMNSLDAGRKQLITDNKILSSDQTRMRDITLQLEQVIQIGQRMDELLTARLEASELDEQEATFIETELLFPLRQKIQDVYQQLLVNQQGYIAIELIIRNNRELIRGVQRAKDVTITALQVAVTVALALNNQKIVLDKISALNVTTDRLLSRTSQMLATQGVDIQKQASRTMLNMESLKTNFQTLNSAIKDLSEFRQKALPEMANAITTMETLANEAEQEIQKMEKGDAVQQTTLIFDLDTEVTA